MLIEPSECTFRKLMLKRFKVGSYNGGDQGFLNEVFTWWHRWPARLNFLKFFGNQSDNFQHKIPGNLYAIHYLGLKPWICYQDYDCNWDIPRYQDFASDFAHEKWWQIYGSMPKKLRPFCDLTPKMDARIKKWRVKAEKFNLPNRHWKIKVKDRRRHLWIARGNQVLLLWANKALAGGNATIFLCSKNWLFLEIWFDVNIRRIHVKIPLRKCVGKSNGINGLSEFNWLNNNYKWYGLHNNWEWNYGLLIWNFIFIFFQKYPYCTTNHYKI